MWKPEATFELITLDSDFFSAKFEALHDYEFAKFEGPWMIMDHYLVVQEWEPNFDPRDAKPSKLLAWVHFPALPVEYFDDEFLVKIGKNAGRPIKVDNTTSLVSKGSFARVCVEIDISKPLISKFTLEQKVWPIVYEGLHLVCFSCGLYGHKAEQCGKDSPMVPQVPVEEDAPIQNRGAHPETRNIFTNQRQSAATSSRITLVLRCWFQRKREEVEVEVVAVQLQGIIRQGLLCIPQGSRKEKLIRNHASRC